jgi:hypothetical protein
MRGYATFANFVTNTFMHQAMSEQRSDIHFPMGDTHKTP